MPRNGNVSEFCDMSCNAGKDGSIGKEDKAPSGVGRLLVVVVAGDCRLGVAI